MNSYVYIPDVLDIDCEHERSLSNSRNLSTGFPLTLFLITLLVNVGSSTILLAIQPLSLVDPAVGPLEDAKALLLVFKIIALVGVAVRPGIDALTMHHTSFPAAVVFATIGPRVRADPFNHDSLPYSSFFQAVWIN